VPDLSASRPPLDAELVRAQAGDGWRLEVVESAPSTNAAVAARARAGESAGLALVAEHQTAGRGRLDRVWVTPPRAALACSLLLQPDDVPVQAWPWLPLLAGLAVVDAVKGAADGHLAAPVGLKWPNDVLVGELKVAGILVERVERQAGAVAVVGVGVNVGSTREELPVASATSLALEGAQVDRSVLLAGVLTAFADRYATWRAASGRGPRSAYAEACTTIGRHVRVELPDGRSLRGRAVDVDAEGRLLVDDGTRVQALGAGDVVHVRPAGPSSAL
jgi:BirA family biotin operon repressor/biotin-[acetyl-CoA-carboxylase] ligase